MDFPELMQKARSADTRVRLEAVRELSALESPDALSVLQALGAADGDLEVRLEASRAARELRTRLSTGTMDLAAKAGVGVPALTERLRSPEPGERAKAIYGCLRYESERVLSAILDLLEREASARVRAIAVAAVGVLGSANEAEPVRRFLRDPDLAVRAAADEALKKLAELEPPLPQMPPQAAPPPEQAPRAATGYKPPVTTTRSLTMPGAVRPGLAPAPGAVKPSSSGIFSPPRVGTSPGAVKPGVGGRPMSKPAVLKPLAEQMNEDEKTKLARLLSSLSGGFLPDVEKARLADRGSRLYQEIGARLGLPAMPPPVARGLFFLASENRAGAAQAFREAPQPALLEAYLQPFLKSAFDEKELTELLTVKEETEVALTGRDKFPPEILELVLSTIRKAKSMMNELDVRERTKFRPAYDGLRDLLNAGNVVEGQQAALVLKREMTRLSNILNDRKNAALLAKRK